MFTKIHIKPGMCKIKQVVKANFLFRHKAASPPHMDGSFVFVRLRQRAPHPRAHSSLHPKCHLDRFSPICTAHNRVSLYIYFTMGRPFSLKIAPSLGGSGPPAKSNNASLDPPESTYTNGISIGSAFLQDSRL